MTARRWWTIGTLAVMAAAVAGAAGGCQQARIGEPLTETLGGPAFEQQMAFWHELNDRPITSHDEAFHALLLFFDGEATAETYEQRVAALQERGWLDDDFDREPDVAVTRGTLAVALARALEIDGGLIMRVIGPTPRYATRELVYVNIYPPSTSHQTFSGAQFVAVMGRVEDYQRRDAAAARLADGEADAD